MSTIEQLVLQAKTCFQNKDYETCMSLTHEILRADAGNTEASWLLKEAQRQWEDQRSLEQLEIYVENLKREAMDLFDKERYEQCLGMFRFLSELEPENHTLRDYLRLSQQMYVETIGSKEPNGDRVIAGDPNVETQFEPSRLAVESPEEDSSDRLPEEIPDPARESSAVAIPEAEPHAVVMQAESVPPDVKQQLIQECIASTTQSRRRRHWILLLTASVILLLGLGAWAFWPHSPPPEGRIEIQSTPEGAIVYVDDKRVGETPLRQYIIAVGGHVVRVEKQGYESYSRKLAAEPAQSIVLAVQLEKVKVALPPVEQAAPPAEPRNELPIAVPQDQPALTALPAVASPVEVETPSVQLAQSVIHHHLIGSCTGRLKIDGDRISFWSSGNTQDAFTRKIKQIMKFELSENLMIEFKDKTYRFESLVRDKDNHQLASFYEQIRLQKSRKRL